ncbi:MAG: D-alanine--D-alanine ligase [Gammaproteobacteria bacterium]|nr:D-alanine--D-alanine ligase [Gammaproteobacteria bacterium]
MRVAIVCGGPSPEAEVSRVSGQCFADGLHRRGHHVTRLELSPRLADDLAACAPEVVVPMLHGVPGEDGSVQAFLDVLGYAYVGSGHAASATAIRKSLTKLVARRARLPVADDFIVRRGDDTAAMSRDSIAHLGTSLVVKPDTQGSALGVRLLHDMTSASLHAELDSAMSAYDQLLIEPFMDGAELTVGVLDEYGAEPVAFPVIEIRTPESAWYDYEHRYAAGLSTHLVPAPIPEGDAKRMQDAAVALHTAIGCTDLSRTDFIRSPSGEVVLLELNNLPGMTPTSLYPDGASAIGIGFDELVERLATSAKARGPAIKW